MPDHSKRPSTISPDDLLAMIGTSPADNIEGYNEAVLWKSENVGRTVKEIFKFKELLGDVEKQGLLFGPISLAAGLGKSLLESWVTAPTERGAGRAFQGPLLKVARQHGAETAFLEVRESNRRARALYRRLGFVEVGRRRDYYPALNGREDALVLSLNL